MGVLSWPTWCRRARRCADAFDDLHRCLDPSHAGVLLEAEMAGLLESKVGPLTYGETSEPFLIPVDAILTDAADRDAVAKALEAELAGGAATGFDPVVEDGRTLVSFTNTVVHAERATALADPAAEHRWTPRRAPRSSCRWKPTRGSR